MTTETTTAIEPFTLESPVPTFPTSDEAIESLRANMVGLTAKTPAGYKAVKSARQELRKARTGVEERRVELKAGALEWGRKVDGEAKRLTGLIKEIEVALDAEIQAADQVKEAALARVAQDGAITTLEAAFRCWLRGEAAPIEAEQTFASPLRDYRDVALAALGEVAGWSIDPQRLEDGLRWLVDVALDRVGVPAPVVSDSLAHVCLGLAARERPWLATWHDQVLARAADTMQPAWLAGGGRVARGQVSVCAPELRVALASRGIATSTDAEANAVLEGLLRGELPEDAFHAQVMLAALAWIRRAAPIAIPGQATPEIVARLLAEAPPIKVTT